LSRTGWPLGPRAARVFYAVADAWRGEGGGDAVAALAGELDGPRARRRLERRLLLLEWSPRLLLHSRRGFAWLARGERRAWLERLARGPRGVARAIDELRRLATRDRDAAAAPAGDYSLLGGA